MIAQSLQTPPVERHSEPSPQKYTLLARLDRGGMADVYLALSRGPNDFKKLMVVKCLRVVSGQEELCRTMFIEEARLSARLNHPNVVQTYEISETEGRPLIAMEYLEGQSLARLRKAAKTIDPRRAVRILCDALAGLHYAHELRDFDGVPFNIVHRDLSPQNIFVTYDGVVKILDFGVARAELPARTRTKVGVVKGKFSYMAPEQTSGDAIDRRTDIFTTGIVLWELIAGQRMFSGTAVQKLKSLIHDPIPTLSSVRPGVDPELERVVMKALDKDPAGRHPTADALRADLEQYLTRSGPPVRSDDIARLMLAHFSVERHELRLELQELMAAESSMPGSVPALKSAPLTDVPSIPPNSLSPVTHPQVVIPAAVVANDDEAVPWGRERRRALYVGFGLVTLLMAAAGTLLGVHHEPDSPPPSMTTAAAPAAVAAPAAQALASPPAGDMDLPLPATQVSVAARSEANAVTRAGSRVRRAPAPARGAVAARAAVPTRAAGPAVPESPAEPASGTAAPAGARVRLVEDKPRMPILD
jgi:serine/threonine protein kinase